MQRSAGHCRARSTFFNIAHQDKPSCSGCLIVVCAHTREGDDSRSCTRNLEEFFTVPRNIFYIIGVVVVVIVVLKLLGLY